MGFFLRHRQRAITAVSAGKVIIPKRSIGPSRPVYQWTIEDGGTYNGYMAGSYGEHSDPAMREFRVGQSNNLMVVKFFTGQPFGVLMQAWIDGWAGDDLLLAWTTNQYQGNVSGLSNWVGARIGQTLGTSYDVPEE